MIYVQSVDAAFAPQGQILRRMPDETTSLTQDQDPSQERPPTTTRKAVFYCKTCSFPVEYCEYGPSISKCKDWLSKENPELFDKLYHKLNSIELESLTLEEREKYEKSEKEALKKEAKQQAKVERAKEKVKSSKVTVKTVERTKRKRITAIHGLDTFGVDLKKLAKLFANRFATGSSVTKNAQGDDEIVIQGDVSDEVLDLFEETSGKFADIIGNGKIPDENIVFVDETKKKKPT
ncbi:hypothetical protein O181_021047 [Austropuccinia psidii MF-1]|uniref:Translation machinery-associated protein 22 n=1 Tax=Austropuccinia psidii MF-1 TaxID=1389203 RepID=A0A9Q3GVW3_9BASI|nr:hypothetical protein [Austropuccinia psidii MF-1]